MKNRFKIIRKKLGLTQTELGIKLGRGLRAIQHYEKGERGIDDALILLLEKTYNVNIDWMRTGEGAMFNDEPQANIIKTKSSHDAMILNALPHMSDEEKEHILKYIDERLKISELRAQPAELKKENAG